MSLGDKEIHQRRSSCAHVLRQTQPSFFAFLGTGRQSRDLFVPFQIDSQCRQNDAGIAFCSMTNLKMHSIQVHHAPMRMQATLPPRFKLLGEALVQTADGTVYFEPLP